VNLVEVESLTALKTFNQKFLAGRGYEAYLTQGKDTFTGQDVGLLTRIDPDTIPIKYDDRVGHSGSVNKSVSKDYIARFTVGNLKFSLIGLHFLAIPLSENRKLERQAQADAIRSIAIEERTAGFLPVMLGDFNDYDGEALSRDDIDSMPISTVLSSIRAMATDSGSDDLVNASSFLPKAGRYTAFFDANQNEQIDMPGEFTSIDHILLSPELASKVQLVEMPHLHDPRVVTDHFPVVVRLKLQDAAPPLPAINIRVISLLPNPPGSDNLNEEATIKNLGSQSVSLAGWKLRDLTGSTWSLSNLGTLAPGQQKTIKRNNQPMALNNGGDTIELVDPSNAVKQTINYGPVNEGEVVIP
jgi:exonuclease III